MPSNPKKLYKKKQSWSIYSALQDLLLNDYNKDSVVLAKGQTNKSLEQNREPTNRTTYIQSNNFWQKCQSNLIE